MNVEISPKYEGSDRFIICLNGEKWREIHRSIFGKKPQFPVNEDKPLALQFTNWEYERVRNYVVWRLSTQSYHSQELVQLLKKRLVSLETIEKVIQEFIQKGFFSDALWIQSFIRVHRKRLALSAILQKMRLKGISDDEIENARQLYQNENEEQNHLINLIKTRYRSKNLTDFTSKQKVINSLLRKGFSFEVIKKAITAINNSDEDSF